MRNNLKKLFALTLLSIIAPFTAMAQERIANLGEFPEWKKKPAEIHVAHITDKTRRIKSGMYAQMKPVYDGVFSVECNGVLSFYVAKDASCISSGKLRSISGAAPDGSRFSGNVCMAVSNQKQGGRNPFVILHRDGTVKQLHPEWVSATNFADGMASIAMNDQRYLSHSFFIDEDGNKILPQHNYDQQKNKGFSNASVTEVKPLSEGLRPFYSRNDKCWGYLDAKGNTVIKPQFSSARGFSEGYAAVTRLDEKRNGKVQFIDKTGRVVFDTGVTCYSLDSEDRIGDVSGGLIRVWEKGQTATSYYSPDGKLLNTFTGFKGTDVVDGHIFLRSESSSGDMFMLDTNFKPLRAIKVDPSIYWELPKFNKSALALVNSNTVINSDGDVVLTSKDAIQALCEDGYIINIFNIDNREYAGLTNISGECVALLVDGNNEDENNEETPQDTVATMKFHVNVVCLPEEGGTATGAGEYEYGAKAMVEATANQGYKCSSMVCSANGSVKSGAVNAYEVRDTMTIYVNFVKEDVLVAPTENDAYLGQFKYTYSDKGVDMKISELVDLYMELSQKPDINTPYGNRYGVLQIQFDVYKRYSLAPTLETGKEEKSDAPKSNFYYAPYEILGFVEDDGKKWMIIDGGGPRWCGVRGNNEYALQKSNPLFPLQLLLFNMEGIGPVDLSKNTMRIEIADVAADGSITFGKTQGFSPKFGWLGGQDKRLHRMNLAVSAMPIRIDLGGLPEDLFNGVVMKPSEKREIEWSTPKEWFKLLESTLKRKGKDPAAQYELTKQKSMDRYKKYKSAYTKFWEKKQ